MSKGNLYKDTFSGNGPYSVFLKLAIDMRQDIKDLKDIVHKELGNSRLSAPIEKNTSNSKQEVLLTTQEVMKMFKISARTMYNYRKTKKLSSVKIGRKYLYRKEDIERLIEPAQE